MLAPIFFYVRGYPESSPMDSWLPWSSSKASCRRCSRRCSACHSLQRRHSAGVGQCSIRRRAMGISIACGGLHASLQAAQLPRHAQPGSHRQALLQHTHCRSASTQPQLTFARWPPPPGAPAWPAPQHCIGRPPRTRRQSSSAPKPTPPGRYQSGKELKEFVSVRCTQKNSQFP